jgi:hypothetical protein
MPLTTNFENSNREAREDSSGEEERISSNGGRLSAIDLDEVEAERGVSASGEDPVVNEKDEPVTWMSLPHKRQLLVLGLSRLSEPLVQTSLQVCCVPLFSADGWKLTAWDDRRTCSISSSLSMKVSPMRQFRPKPGCWLLASPEHSF